MKRKNQVKTKKTPSTSQRKRSHQKPTLLIPWSWASSLQSCERINFCCLSHPVCNILLCNPSKLILHRPWQIYPKEVKNPKMGASLVARWLRIHLPMQGTRVRALVREDPTCCGATKPMRHNYWACALEPASHNYWAHASRACALQQEKPLQWEARALQQRVAPARHN